MEVKEFIKKHLEIFYKMDKHGVKNIATAIDYLSIYEEYQNYTWIKSCNERKSVVANKFKVSIRSVEMAIKLMEKRV